MIRATARVENPDAVELTCTITMTAGHWRDVMRQLGHQYPAWAFSAVIADAIGKTVGGVSHAHEVKP